MAGQYLIYYDLSLYDETVLYAYDLNTGEVFELLGIAELPSPMNIPEILSECTTEYSGNSTAYFVVQDDGEDTIYRIVIKDGKAGFEEVSVIAGRPDVEW